MKKILKFNKMGADGYLSIEILRNDSEYEVTRGRFEIWSTSCSDDGPSQRMEFEATFGSERAVIDTSGSNVPEAKCVKTVKLWGIRK